VTGCRGFIGGALTRRLTSLGAHLILPVRPNTPAPEIFTNLKQIVVQEISLSNVPIMEQIIRQYRVKTVFHMAANNDNRDTKGSPLSIFEDNIRATYSILEACRRSCIDRVVLASSQESDRQLHKSGAKMHPYGASKASTELVARSYVESYALPVIVVKPDNVYGPGDLNFRRLIPSTIMELLRREKLKFNGNPNTERGFIYIDDLIDALLIVGDTRTGSLPSDCIINLHARELHRIGDILSLLEKLTKTASKKPHTNIEIRSNPSPKTLAISDWQATVPLNEGLQQTIAYYRNKLAPN